MPQITVMGDKSITHRLLMLAAAHGGEFLIKNTLNSLDTATTALFIQSLGCELFWTDSELTIKSDGFQKFVEHDLLIDCQNSGTTMRLGMGLVAGRSGNTTFLGDASLDQRPMQRVYDPLGLFGLITHTSQQNNRRQINCRQGKPWLQSVEYSLPMASAQLKSAMLLASLVTQTPLALHSIGMSRDHTEKMLSHFGYNIETQLQTIKFLPQRPLTLKKFEYEVCGDFSSASFWIFLVMLCPNSKLKICNVGLNSTRTGFLNVLERMGAKILTTYTAIKHHEPCGTIEVWHSNLQNVKITQEEMPTLIDEAPLIILLSAFADGQMIMENVSELFIKESNRAQAVADVLLQLGVEVDFENHVLVVQGKKQPRLTPSTSLKQNGFETFGDHRLAMAYTLLNFALTPKVSCTEVESVQTSYPDFFRTLQKLQQECEWLKI